MESGMDNFIIKSNIENSSPVQLNNAQWQTMCLILCIVLSHFLTIFYASYFLKKGQKYT